MMHSAPRGQDSTAQANGLGTPNNNLVFKARRAAIYAVNCGPLGLKNKRNTAKPWASPRAIEFCPLGAKSSRNGCAIKFPTSSCECCAGPSTEISDLRFQKGWWACARWRELVQPY